MSLDAVGFHTDVKVFHFPVSNLNKSESGYIGPLASCSKTSIPNNHKVGCSGAGIQKGSSGAPYVLRYSYWNSCERVNGAEGMTSEEGSDFES